MKSNFILLIFVACLLIERWRLRRGCHARVLPSRDAAAHPELVVSTQWLADHLSDPNLVIVYIGHDEGDYRSAHIPGSRYLAMDKVRHRAHDEVREPNCCHPISSRKTSRPSA